MATTHVDAVVTPPHTTDVPPSRVAAACVSKDSADILPVLVAHYICQGIRDFYLLLHDDDAEVSRKLTESLGHRANFTIYHHRNPVFHQPSMTNMLLELARADGCDVFLPFDSDEFYEPTDPSRRLVDVIGEWVESGNGEQLAVPMYNYFAPRDTETFVPTVLSGMSHRVDVKPGIQKDELNSRFWWLYKSVSRLTGITDAELTNVVIGNHQTLKPLTPLTQFQSETPSDPALPETYPIVIRHIPWRSRAFTLNPVLMDRALITSVAPGEGLSQAELTELFESTWNAYSLAPDVDARATYEREQFTLVPDDAFVRILANVASHGFDTSDSWCPSHHGSSVAEGEGSTRFTSRVHVDDPAFDAGVMATNAQLKRAEAERDRGNTRALNKDAQIERLRSRVEQLTAQKAGLAERVTRLREKLDARNAVNRSNSSEATPSPPPSPEPARPGLVVRALRRLRRVILRRGR